MKNLSITIIQLIYSFIVILFGQYALDLINTNLLVNISSITCLFITIVILIPCNKILGNFLKGI